MQTSKQLRVEPMHGHGLCEDLARLEAQRRRRALGWIATAAGTALMLTATGVLAQRPGGGSPATRGDGTGSARGGSSAKGGPSGSASKTGGCVAAPAETAGPYPADGTNKAPGPTSDTLTSSGIVRSDIRSSFIGSSNLATGAALTLTLSLVDTSSSCASLAGYAVYLWHCDRSGDYSLYTAPTESYLRGVQVTDDAGQATFVTIFPGCYSGRYPHIHFEVFPSLAVATTGRSAILTSQLAMPRDVCAALYSNAAGYGPSMANFASVSTARDYVFGDHSAAQIAAMTPTMSGSAAGGYTGSATIGIAR